MKKKEIMDVVFLLDKSGSMHGMEENTIDGYNKYLENMKGNDVKVTTVLFDSNMEMICERQDIKKVRKLDTKTYYTGGSTALMDAIGKTITFLEKEESKKVLFVITTDGYENSSITYDKKDIKKLIKKHNDWEFIYLGADIDSYNEASSIGISKERTSNYAKSKDGIGAVFKNLSNISAAFYDDEEISSNWKDGLEDYIKNNKEK